MHITNQSRQCPYNNHVVFCNKHVVCLLQLYTVYWHRFAHHFEFASIVTVTPIKPKFQGSRSFVHCLTVSTHILVQFNIMCPCLCIGSKSGCELAPKITSLHTRGNEPLEGCTLAHCCSFIMIVHIYYTVNSYKIL